MSQTRARAIAVVLAGGGADDELARSAGAASKALVPIDGAPMGAYVLSSLRGSGLVPAIVYVGPTDDRTRALVDQVVPPGRRMVDSLAMGFGAALALAAPGDRLMVVTADIPWWTAEGVRAFLEGAPDADLVYPAVTAATAEAAFPGQRRTFVRLRDGRFTGGNAVLLSQAAVPALLPVVDQIFSARKAPWRLASLIGLDVLWGLLTGRARLSEVEARVSRLLGLEGRVMVSDDAAIAADIDRPEQLSSAAREGPPLAPLQGPA
jgi:molybdopterin-guanine dinucleotide biosynthesis protein A